MGAFSSRMTIYSIPQSRQWACVSSNIASVSGSYQTLAEMPNCFLKEITKSFRSVSIGLSPTAQTITSHVLTVTSSGSCIADWMIRSTLMLTPTAPYPGGSSRPRENIEISLSYRPPAASMSMLLALALRFLSATNWNNAPDMYWMLYTRLGYRTTCRVKPRMKIWWTTEYTVLRSENNHSVKPAIKRDGREEGFKIDSKFKLSPFSTLLSTEISNLGILVVDILFRNLVVGNFWANCWRWKFSKVHGGIPVL